jgi:hypothetical protein
MNGGQELPVGPKTSIRQRTALSALIINAKQAAASTETTAYAAIHSAIFVAQLYSRRKKSPAP